jgi:hypothetical protein
MKNKKTAASTAAQQNLFDLLTDDRSISKICAFNYYENGGRLQSDLTFCLSKYKTVLKLFRRFGYGKAKSAIDHARNAKTRAAKLTSFPGRVSFDK